MYPLLAQFGSNMDRAVGNGIDAVTWWGTLIQYGIIAVIAIVGLSIFAAVVGVLLQLVVAKVPSGHLGILETWEKGDENSIRRPGTLVWMQPLRNQLKLVDLRTRLTQAHLLKDNRITVQTKNGATVTANYIVSWRVGVTRPDAMTDQEYSTALDKAVIASAYKAENLKEVVETAAAHAVRAALAAHDVGELARMRDEVAGSVKEQLARKMGDYGVVIEDVSLTEVSPDEKVKQQMDAVTEAEFRKMAAKASAEAQAVPIIVAAEAEAKAAQIRGQGVASELVEIGLGYVAAVAAVTPDGQPPLDGVGLLTALLQHRHTDVLMEHAGSGRTNAIIHTNGTPAADHIDETAVAILAADNAVTDGPSSLQASQGNPETLEQLRAKAPAVAQVANVARSRAQTTAGRLRERALKTSVGRRVVQALDHVSDGA